MRTKRVVVGSCLLVLSVQIAVWMMIGRESLDDAAHMGILEEYLNSDILEGSDSQARCYLVIEDDGVEISSDVVSKSNLLLQAAGMGRLMLGRTADWETAHSCAAVRLKEELNTPLVGIVGVQFGGKDALAFHFGYSDLRLHLFGIWLHLARIDQWES